MPRASPGSRSTSPAPRPTCSRASVLTELDALLATLERRPPRGVVVMSAKKSGFVAGADIKEFTGITDAASGYQLIHRGQQVLDRLESAALPDGRGDSWLRARRRPRARPRLPLPRRRSAMSACRSGCPRCCSAFIRASAARCAAVRVAGRARRDGDDADRQAAARATGARRRPGRPAGDRGASCAAAPRELLLPAARAAPRTARRSGC